MASGRAWLRKEARERLPAAQESAAKRSQEQGVERDPRVLGAFKVGAPAGALEEAGGWKRPGAVAETPSRKSVLAIIRPGIPPQWSRPCHYAGKPRFIMPS